MRKAVLEAVNYRSSSLPDRKEKEGERAALLCTWATGITCSLVSIQCYIINYKTQQIKSTANKENQH